MTCTEKLPEAELDVMTVLWEFHEPVRTARILERLQGRRGWTLSTLKVILGRLVDKGLVEVTREGRFTLYRALLRQSDYRRRETRGILQRYYKNSVKNLIASLVREEDLSDRDLEELEEILRKAGREK